MEKLLLTGFRGFKSASTLFTPTTPPFVQGHGIGGVDNINELLYYPNPEALTGGAKSLDQPAEIPFPEDWKTGRPFRNGELLRMFRPKTLHLLTASLRVIL